MGGMTGGFGGIGDVFNSPANSVGGGGAFGMLSGGNTPQDRGFGLQDPNQFMMFSTGAGLGAGDGTGMESLDMTGPGWGEAFFGATGQQYAQPGSGEHYFAQNAHRFGQPGNGQQFWDQGAKQRMGQPGIGENTAKDSVNRFGQGRNPNVTNNAQGYYQAHMRNRPSFDQDAGLGAYYDNAKKRSLESLGQQAAARGAYGSSAALSGEQRAITDLEAERANREADFKLRSLGEQRGWEGLGGSLAQAADANSAQQSQNQLAWTQGINNMANQGQQLGFQRDQGAIASALGLDNFGLNQLNSGMGAAETSQGLALNRLQQGQNASQMAQQLQQDRGNQLFQRNMQLGNAVSGIAGDTYDQMLGVDQALMDSAIAMELGLGAEALNQSYRNQQRQKDDASWAVDTVGSIMPMLGGM